jgi:hypothetical protein
MEALQPGKPRAVSCFYKKDGEQIVEAVYDSHTQEYGERTDVPTPDKIDYSFCLYDDKTEEAKYLKMYQMFPQTA